MEDETIYALSEGSQDLTSEMVAGDPTNEKPELVEASKRLVYTISFKLTKNGEELPEVHSGILPENGEGGHGNVEDSLKSLVTYHIGLLEKADNVVIPAFN